MTNATGTPIWYELMTPDPDGAKAFYEGVVGWSIAPSMPGPVDYRLISAPDGPIAGMLHLDAQMQAGGARAGWLIYFGVDDVDAAFEKAKTLGASVHVPPSDIPNVGRFAFLSDPQGAPFYIMKGNSPEDSKAFSRGLAGHGSWNELWTGDIPAAMTFYGGLFGMENRETMDMGPMGGYHFLDVGDLRIGAAAQMPNAPTQWNAYLAVPDLDEAVKQVKALGGAVTMGPHDVPSGERIVLGTDPQGASFALVAPGQAG